MWKSAYSLYAQCPDQGNPSRQKVYQGLPGAGRGEGNHCLKSAERLFRKKVLEVDGDDGYTAL